MPSPRYYYDLPMTMVWLSAAMLAHARHHAVGSAILASLGFVLACSIKGPRCRRPPIVLAGVLLAARQDRARAPRSSVRAVTTLLLLPILVRTNFGAMGARRSNRPRCVASRLSASLDAVRPGWSMPSGP